MTATCRFIDEIGDSCCGCGACAACCPKACIELSADSLGFLYPEVDAALCVKCGVCDRICPVLNNETGASVGECGVWWARSENVGLLERSSSGAVFGELAQRTLSLGGVVYGAAFADNCHSVVQKRIDSNKDLDLVMRSKYLQGTVPSDVYAAVQRDLRDGYEVLFSGVACQVAGLRNYLGKNQDSSNLLCVDVICHGVPSPKLWAQYVDHVVGASKNGINEVNFRSKSAGWQTYSLLFERNKEKVRSLIFSKDWYMKAFLANASLRSSCFECPAKGKCGSDITLGDYWGIQAAHPDVDCSRGVSAVLANTEKGAQVFRSLFSRFEYGESTLEQVLAGNPSLLESAKPCRGRDDFVAALGDADSVEPLMRIWDFEPTVVQRIRSGLGRVKRKLFG